MGRKKQPHYRVVVADGASPRDGRFVETLGYYRPLTHPARLVLDLERVDHWIAQGAQASGTVKSLIAKARQGGDETVQLGEVAAEERKQKRAEALAARRAAEKRMQEEKAEQKTQAETAVSAEAETSAEGETSSEGEAAGAAEGAEADAAAAPSAEGKEGETS